MSSKSSYAVFIRESAKIHLSCDALHAGSGGVRQSQLCCSSKLRAEICEKLRGQKLDELGLI